MIIVDLVAVLTIFGLIFLFAGFLINLLVALVSYFEHKRNAYFFAEKFSYMTFKEFQNFYKNNITNDHAPWLEVPSCFGFCMDTITKKGDTLECFDNFIRIEDKYIIIKSFVEYYKYFSWGLKIKRNIITKGVNVRSYHWEEDYDKDN